MSIARSHSPAVISALFLLLVLANSAWAQGAAPPIDSTLFTTYTTDIAFDTLSWEVCGSTQNSFGCFGGGNVGPFGRVGAILEGNPSIQGNIVTRAIYVVDVQDNGVGVRLYVYKKTDTITSSDDIVTVTLNKSVSLPLTGGPAASCFMAANKGFLFIGTDQGSHAVELKKGSLAITTIFGGANISSITADQYGYVTVNWGALGTGFNLYGPNGALSEFGGGTQFLVDTVNGVMPSALPH